MEGNELKHRMLRSEPGTQKCSINILAVIITVCLCHRLMCSSDVGSESPRVKQSLLGQLEEFMECHGTECVTSGMTLPICHMVSEPSSGNDCIALQHGSSLLSF